jgi:trans-aconitate 2-methyltransferase
MSEYSWNAKDYAKHSAAQQGWARELIAKLQLEGHESILDIGCGDGKVTAEIAAAVPQGSVLGIDNSSSMIELAQREFPAAQYPNLTFQLADARRLTFDQQFEVVFSNAALHWVRNHIPVLDSIYKSLCRGGRILLQMGGRGNAASIIMILDAMKKTEKWRSYYTDFKFPYGFHDTAKYKKWLQKTGFQSIRADLIPKDMTHAGQIELAGWIRTTWLPYTQRIPDMLKEVFIEELVHTYIQNYPIDKDGKIHVQMIRLEVEAGKPV